jgi:hypothetical protein
MVRCITSPAAHWCNLQLRGNINQQFSGHYSYGFSGNIATDWPSPDYFYYQTTPFLSYSLTPASRIVTGGGQLLVFEFIFDLRCLYAIVYGKNEFSFSGHFQAFFSLFFNP